MNLHLFLRPVLTLLVIAAGGYAAYTTRERWWPHVFPSAVTAETPTDHADHGDHDHENEVTLSIQAQRNLSLEVSHPTPQEYWRTILIPGQVVDRPGESNRTIITRVAGIVTEIVARPGDTARPGDHLYTLQLASEFLQTAQSDLAKAARELQFAITKRDRIATQVQQETTPGAALIDEEMQVKRLKTQMQAYCRQLELFGLSPQQVERAENGDVITELVISAPSSTTSFWGGSAASAEDAYEVNELKVRLGDHVQPGQTLCTLVNHRRLFVEGRAFKSEARALAQTAQDHAPVSVEFADEAPGEWKSPEPMFIRHFASEVDPVSRTLAFYLPLQNESLTIDREGQNVPIWRYRPGQRARLRVPIERLFTVGTDGTTEVLPFVLPSGALVREGPEAYVFVQSGDVFKRVPVHVLHESRTEVVIANDGSITGADYVVMNQAIAINRALKAVGETGGGHHHDH